jgi:hypothetical protein
MEDKFTTPVQDVPYGDLQELYTSLFNKFKKVGCCLLVCSVVVCSTDRHSRRPRLSALYMHKRR